MPETLTATPAAAIRPPNRRASIWRYVAIVTGLIGAILCLASPFLPVTQNTATISWPQLTPQSTSASVNAPLVTQTPQELHATIPCTVVQSLPADGGTVVSTMPSNSPIGPSNQLAITANKTNVDIVSRGTNLVSAPRSRVASAGCQAIRVDVTPHNVTASFDGLGLNGSGPVDIKPQVGGIYTDLAPRQLAGTATSIKVIVDTRWNTEASTVKLTALIIGVLCAVVSLIALGLLDRAYGWNRSLGFTRRRTRFRPQWTDAAVVGILVVWNFLGAGTSDDGYLLTMARNANESGYIANYYRYFGAPDTPFDWYTGFLAHWSQVSTSGIWMRTPSIIAGIVTWLLISRVLLPRMGRAITTSFFARWASALVFVVFWMPYNAGLRPEPIIVLGSILTWVFAERAIATRRTLPAALAVLVAVMTFAAAPAGVIGIAVLVMAVRPVIANIVARRRDTGILAQILPIIAAGSIAVAVMFRDQTIMGAAEAMRLRYTVGPVTSWNKAYMRYYTATVQLGDGTVALRVPLVLLFSCLIVTLFIMLRRGRIARLDPKPVWRAVGIVLVTMLLLIPTPTKWVVQFGIYAGVAAVLAAITTVGVVSSARSNLRNLSLFIGCLLIALAFCAAGYNDWPYALDYGVPWYDRAPVLAGKEISTILLGLALIALAFAAWQHFRQDYVRNKGLTEAHSEVDDEAIARVDTKAAAKDRRRLLIASSPIAVVAALLIVAELLIFVKAAVWRADGFSVAKENFAALTNGCGMADYVLVEQDPNKYMLKPANGESATDALTNPSDPTNIGFSPDGEPSDMTSDAISIAPGMIGSAPKSWEDPGVLVGEYPGLGGGPSSSVTVNGSHTRLPFGLNTSTPVLGSYGYNAPAKLTTAWYSLPARNPNAPLLVFSAAGAIRSTNEDGVTTWGQTVTVDYGVRGPDGKFIKQGTVFPIDTGPNRPWRNLRIPMDQIPTTATAVRIVANDTSVNPKQWLAITPPRVPVLRTLQQVVGSSDPVLLDLAVAAQFPCQRPMRYIDGISEIPRWRITPDRKMMLRSSNTWQSPEGGGPLGVTAAVTGSDTVGTYLKNDWHRDWGSLSRMWLDQNVPEASVVTGRATREGWWRPGPVPASKAQTS